MTMTHLLMIFIQQYGPILSSYYGSVHLGPLGFAELFMATALKEKHK